MGQEDLYQSDFYEDNNRFSDVFNGVLFHGKDVMKPEELETVKAILGILGVKSNIDKIKYSDEKGNEVYDMCKAFDDYKEEGKREGKREGMQDMAMMIRNLMKNQKVTFEVAAEMTGISKGKQKQLKNLI